MAKIKSDKYVTAGKYNNLSDQHTRNANRVYCYQALLGIVIYRYMIGKEKIKKSVKQTTIVIFQRTIFKGINEMTIGDQGQGHNKRQKPFCTNSTKLFSFKKSLNCKFFQTWSFFLFFHQHL
jgi:hypothetical protein